MFISEMMRGMRESLLSEEQDQGLGSETMTDTFDTEFGRSMSSAGGLGLARVMMEGLRKQLGVTSEVGQPAASGSASGAAAAPGSAAFAAPSPSRDAAPAVQAPQADWTGASTGEVQALPGPVTSKFGWRADPFTGRPQFHAGTDVRMAYGHDVQSVAAGRVKSVGDQQGYGLTVVIDHGQGLETRYAHLSNASVKAGDVVDSGQVVAHSGSSGRSTGPHLHLEARQNGRAVEMAALLKSSGMSADSYAEDRSSVRSGQ